MKENKRGRPTEENPRNIQLKIKVTEEEYKRIDELAEKMGMTKSRLLRNLALGGLEDAEFFQKIGILPLVKNIIDFKNKFNNL